jgi:hypothetical protein
MTNSPLKLYETVTLKSTTTKNPATSNNNNSTPLTTSPIKKEVTAPNPLIDLLHDAIEKNNLETIRGVSFLNYSGDGLRKMELLVCDLVPIWNGKQDHWRSYGKKVIA